MGRWGGERSWDQARERQLMTQAFFIGGLQDPRTEVVMNLDACFEELPSHTHDPVAVIKR